MRSIERIKEVLRRWGEDNPAIAGIAIYGSYAKGTAHSNSDLDLFILPSRIDSEPVPPGEVKGDGESGSESLTRPTVEWEEELTKLLAIDVSICCPEDSRCTRYARVGPRINAYDRHGKLKEFFKKTISRQSDL